MQQFVIMGLVDRGGWLYGLFGVLFLICGIISLISPENTFAALADILGFLFLIVGVFWIIQAFVSREINELWWLGLIAGILMVILAFWTGGQFFIEKQYVLLVFAGIWALMQGSPTSSAPSRSASSARWSERIGCGPMAMPGREHSPQLAST